MARALSKLKIFFFLARGWPVQPRWQVRNGLFMKSGRMLFWAGFTALIHDL